ncbi:MAG: FAD-dependent oxidoreductase [candidate division WOR-3 bacterium]
MERFVVEWPYPVNYEKINEVQVEVLVIGGGISGSWAAITAAKRGASAAVVEEMDVFSAGPAGCDHWHDAFDNPACKISPDKAIEMNERAYTERGIPFNPIGRYITYNESYKTLLELERLGAKIRDTEDEFKGAPFRDEETKLLYAYNYDIKHTIRVWGQTFRQALYAELVRLRVPLYSRILVTSLLTENGKIGRRVIGATGVHTRTGEFYVFKSKSVVLCTGGMDRGNRIFGYTGYVHYSLHSPSVTGGGHAAAWEAGAELAMLGLFGWPGHGTMPSYATGNPHNTWYPCTIVDADGKEIPWVDPITKRQLTFFDERVYANLRGYDVAFALETYPISHGFTNVESFIERCKRGEYKLPLYADLPGMPEHERRVIFGLMVAQEGKTWILYRNLTQAGFDPEKDMLQSYSFGRFWLDPLAETQASRAGAGRAGGLWHDWDFRTNLEGLFVAGDACFAWLEHAGAAVSGRWAGAKAAEHAKGVSFGSINWDQVERERQRVYAPTKRTKGINWKELNVAICTIMRTYVNELSNEEMLKIALKWLEEMEQGEAQKLVARNPHELTRALETLSILTNAKLTVLYMLEKMRRDEIKGLLTMKQKEDGKMGFRVFPPRWWLLPPYEPTYRANYEKHKPW